MFTVCSTLLARTLKNNPPATHAELNPTPINLYGAAYVIDSRQLLHEAR